MRNPVQQSANFFIAQSAFVVAFISAPRLLHAVLCPLRTNNSRPSHRAKDLVLTQNHRSGGFKPEPQVILQVAIDRRLGPKSSEYVASELFS